MTNPASTPSALAREWLEAAAQLGLQVVAPYTLELPGGVQVEVDLLLKSFGGSDGMLLVTDDARLEPHLSAIDWERFGFTTVPEPAPGEALDIEAVIEVLREWGWSGALADRPAWLGPELDVTDDDDTDD